MASPPLPMSFDGDRTFTVQGNFVRVARQHYGAGEVVSLAPWEARNG